RRAFSVHGLTASPAGLMAPAMCIALPCGPCDGPGGVSGYPLGCFVRGLSIGTYCLGLSTMFTEAAQGPQDSEPDVGHVPCLNRSSIGHARCHGAPADSLHTCSAFTASTASSRPTAPRCWPHRRQVITHRNRSSCHSTSKPSSRRPPGLRLGESVIVTTADRAAAYAVARTVFLGRPGRRAHSSANRDRSPFRHTFPAASSATGRGKSG